MTPPSWSSPPPARYVYPMGTAGSRPPFESASTRLVSTRTASLLVGLAVKCGVPRQDIGWSIEESRGSTLPWARYVALLSEIEALAGGPEGLVAMCARFGEVLPHLRGLLSLPRLTDAATVLARSYVGLAYPMLTLRVELVAPGQIHLGYRLPRDWEGSTALAHSLVGTFRGLPRLGALPDAELIIERLGPHSFDALVVLPEEPSSTFPLFAEAPLSLGDELDLAPELAALRDERALIERVVSTLVFAGPTADAITPFAALAAEVLLREAGGTFVRISDAGRQLACIGTPPGVETSASCTDAMILPLDGHAALLELDGPRAPLLRAVAPWLSRELRRRVPG